MAFRFELQKRKPDDIPKLGHRHLNCIAKHGTYLGYFSQILWFKWYFNAQRISSPFLYTTCLTFQKNPLMKLRPTEPHRLLWLALCKKKVELRPPFTLLH